MLTAFDQRINQWKLVLYTLFFQVGPILCQDLGCVLSRYQRFGAVALVTKKRWAQYKGKLVV